MSCHRSTPLLDEESLMRFAFAGSEDDDVEKEIKIRAKVGS